MEDGGRVTPALCFVPEMLVDYLNKSNIEVLQPASFFMHGVCLLVDICGFPERSSQFCDQSKAGIDDLQLAMDGFMGQLVNIIYSFGGDIIKFTQGAILCVFSAERNQDYRHRSSNKSRMSNVFESAETPLFNASISINTPSSISAEVVLRVMHCAKLLTEVKSNKLTVHVAVSCGEMCFGILGGFENRWECIISGPCIHQLSGCLVDAPSEHAVVTCHCAHIVQEALFLVVSFSPSKILTAQIKTSEGVYTFSLHPQPSGNSRIVAVYHVGSEPFPSLLRNSMLLNPKQVALASQFVPLPIADQLKQKSNLQFLAEIREVTTMSMKWDFYDPEVKHRDLLKIQCYFYQAQRILHNLGAYLRQFYVDDKGCVLIACWGVPRFTYHDNADRALTAAVQIKQEFKRCDLKCSFGITTGDVYCGTVGSPLRQEYAAIGSVVNMSARLMYKANGGILFDDTTHSHLRADVLMALDRLITRL